MEQPSTTLCIKGPSDLQKDEIVTRKFQIMQEST